MFEEKRKKRRVIQMPVVRTSGKKEILSDLLSSMHSQNLYGKATSISLKEHPEYAEIEFGKVPTVEELEHKSANNRFSFGGALRSAMEGKGPLSGREPPKMNFAIGGKPLLGNNGKRKWRWI